MRSIFLSFLMFVLCGSMSMTSSVFAEDNPDQSNKLNSEKLLINTSTWDVASEGKYASTDANCDPSKETCTKAQGDSETTTKNLFTSIMNKLMIGIALITVLIIVIGGGCLIFSGGNDGLKTKGKNILIAGVLSLSVAMCSAIIINLVGYILYQ